MGLLTFFPSTSSDTHLQPPNKTPSATPSKPTPKPPSKKQKPVVHRPMRPQPQQQPSSGSWNHFKSLLSCKQTGPHPRVYDPSKKPGPGPAHSGSALGRSSCASICTLRDVVVHGNTARVVHRADISPESSSLGQEARSLARKPAHGSSSRSLASSARSSGTCRSFSSTATTTTTTTSSRGMQLRKLSGCYECRMIVDPSRYPIAPRSTVCACTQCGEIFPKIESLEHHQAVRHAVSELGPEDSGRNIVEIIFKSSWMKKDKPLCKIERILKVHNSPRTLQRFEDCRAAVKSRSASLAAKKNPRCAADGNELLRFHCTSLSCSLGSRGSSSLCGPDPACGVCTIIREGFEGGKGVKTTAGSGRAHDTLDGSDGRRAMLVCRVIAGKIRRAPNEPTASPEDENTSSTAAAASGPASASYDSMAGSTGGVYSNLEDLEVFNPRAILPCFVVIYKTLNIS